MITLVVAHLISLLELEIKYCITFAFHHVVCIWLVYAAFPIIYYLQLFMLVIESLVVFLVFEFHL